jgi:hypothetical protein
MVKNCGHYLKKQKIYATIWFSEDLENTPFKKLYYWQGSIAISNKKILHTSTTALGGHFCSIVI